MKVESTNVEIKHETPTCGKRLLPAVYLSGNDKAEQFQKEFKALLAKYDAEIEIQDFGRNWSTDEKIVVTFAWDKELSDKVNDGIVPDWVVGRWENGR
jgi:predicted lipoprotein with Yx(FWY)xxD motif